MMLNVELLDNKYSINRSIINTFNASIYSPNILAIEDHCAAKKVTREVGKSN